MRQLTLCMGSSFRIAFLMGPFTIFQSLTDTLIGQTGSFALPAVMRVTRIALLSQFTLTHRLQQTLCFRARSQRNLFQGNPIIYLINIVQEVSTLGEHYNKVPLRYVGLLQDFSYCCLGFFVSDFLLFSCYYSDAYFIFLLHPCCSHTRGILHGISTFNSY